MFGRKLTPDQIKTVHGGYQLPDRSLGWGVLNWMAHWVVEPFGEHIGEPFLPTVEEASFVLWWYAVDENGDWSHRDRDMAERRRLAGGTGLLPAVLDYVDSYGPVEFDYFDAEGDPVAKTPRGRQRRPRPEATA